MTTDTASINGQFRKNSATRTPKKLRMLTSAWMRPLCSNCDKASTSVVMRVMTRPAISWS